MRIELQTCALTRPQAERPPSPIIPPLALYPAVAHVAFKASGGVGKSQFSGSKNTFQLVVQTINTAVGQTIFLHFSLHLLVERQTGNIGGKTHATKINLPDSNQLLCGMCENHSANSAPQPKASFGLWILPKRLGLWVVKKLFSIFGQKLIKILDFW